jgi:hypothetical protein
MAPQQPDEELTIPGNQGSLFLSTAKGAIKQAAKLKIEDT